MRGVSFQGAVDINLSAMLRIDADLVARCEQRRSGNRACAAAVTGIEGNSAIAALERYGSADGEAMAIGCHQQHFTRRACARCEQPEVAVEAQVSGACIHKD